MEKEGVVSHPVGSRYITLLYQYSEICPGSKEDKAEMLIDHIRRNGRERNGETTTLK